MLLVYPLLILTLAATCVIVLVVALTRYSRWRRSRSISIIQTWAWEQGATIISVERRGGGPFYFTGRRQSVYYVTIKDQLKQTRQAYIRCGTRWTGLYSDNTDVVWITHPSPRHHEPVA